MKHLLFLLLGILFSISAYADCADTGLWVFPSGQTIKQNTVFVLNGYAMSQKVILGLNEKHKIYLQSGKKKINLLVTELHVGQYHLTQAVLKPETELEAGLEYTMIVDSLPEYERISKYNKITYKPEPATYKVVPGRDLEKPQLFSRPRLLKKILIKYGDGPDIYAVFSNPAKDQSPIIVKTTVKSLKSGKETTYYIEPQKNQIKVGHDMCAGAFDFTDGDKYEVEFSFMDSSGNLTSWVGERIKFTKPTPLNARNTE